MVVIGAIGCEGKRSIKRAPVSVGALLPEYLWRSVSCVATPSHPGNILGVSYPRLSSILQAALASEQGITYCFEIGKPASF